MPNAIPIDDQEWLQVIESNPYLTEESKEYLKARIFPKKTNNAADNVSARDRYKIEATE
jgi:hypothetical protein